MKTNVLTVVGVIINNDGALKEIHCVKNPQESYEMYVNDDPFGIIEVCGFDGLDIREVDAETLTAMAEILRNGSRGRHDGVFKTSTGLAFIDDLETFEVTLQDSAGDKVRKYEGYIDVSDCDLSICEWADEVLDAFNNSMF